MSKVKKYSRQIVVLFLVLATALTCMLAFGPKADAGATAYKWRVSFNLDQGNQNTEGCYLKLYYKTNNGTGTEGSIQLEGDTDAFDRDAEGFYYWVSDSSITGGGKRTTTNSTVPANAFPTKAEVYVFCEGASSSYREFRINNFKLEVLNQSGTVLATSNTGSITIASSENDGTQTSTVSISAGAYPYVTDWAISGIGATTKVNSDGSNTSVPVTISATDNYGVNWVNAPTTTGSNVTVQNGTTASPTLVFANQSADYSATVTSKWTTANTSHSTVSLTSSAATVYVPHTLTIDTDGGTYSGSNPIKGKYTGETATLGTIAKNAYTFASWSKTAGNGSISGSTFTFGNNSATVKPNWTPITYSITPVYGDTTYTAVAYNIESTNIALPTPTRTGYTFAGWEVSAAGGNWRVGDKVTSNPSGHYGNITVSPTWTPNNYSVLFDTVLDFGTWNTASAGNGTISNVTDNGFTLTSNAGVSEATSSSPYFAVTPGESYYVDADITGDAWDVYVFFCDESGTWVDFADSTNRFSSGGAGVASRTFTAPEGAVKAYIRVDANGASNSVTFEDIRVYTVGSAASDVTVPDTSKTVTYTGTYGELPTPTKPHYDFTGWYRADGTQLTADETVLITENLSVFSKWVPHNYTINIDANGGNTAAASIYTIEAGSVPSEITRTGYTFSHWEVSANAGNWVAGTKYNPGDSTVGMHGDVTLKAIWTANDYTLNFDLNAASGSITAPECEKSEMTVTYDSAVGTLPVPTLDGYDFAGWFTAAEGGTEVDASTVYTTADSSTVYAHWTAHTNNIIIDENGGNEVADTTYTIEAGTVPAAITRDGYTFSHWEVAANAGNWTAGKTYDAGASAVGMYGDVTLKAIWTPNEYTVTLEFNVPADSASQEVTGESSITATFDAAVGDLPVPVRNGYAFDGWFTAAEGGEQVTASTVYTTVGDSTYYAHWSVIEYTLSFNVNSGTAIDPITYTVEDEITLPVAERNGYDFTQWIYIAVSTGSWDRGAIYTKDNLELSAGNWGNVTLTANYTVKTFAITWVINGKSEITYHQFNTIPSYDGTPTVEDARYDYTFSGWDPVIEAVSGEATYTAQFTTTPKVYTVTWVDENGMSVHTEDVAYGASIPTDAIDVPAKKGHTGEWDYAGNTTMPAENLTVKPVYTPIEYTVSWEVDGIVVKQDTVAYGTIPSYTGEIPVRAETDEYTYVFSDWTPAISAVEGDTTYAAAFTAIPKEYKINWVVDGNTIAEHTLAYGTPITNIPTVPTKFGYAGSWATIPETMPAEDITIEAIYVEGCVVTWVVDDTEYQMAFANGEEIYYDRGTPSRLATAEYTYTFIGWSETVDGDIVTSFPKATTEDLKYYAVFSATPNEYTITWVAGGSEVYSETLAYGADVTNIPEVPEKTGYTGEWANVPSTMPAANTTVEAVYTPITYIITWVVDGVKTETMWDYDTTPSFSGSTEKASTATTDYTFAGWDTEIKTVTGDATYTATYTESARKYTVTWQYEDGTFIDDDEVANGEAITYIPAIAEKAGHDTKYTIPEVMPTEDIVIVVTYEAKTYTITWSTPSGDITESWKYGETPVYDTEKYGTPSKDATPEKEYTFTGWAPTVTAVEDDITYVAQFGESNRKYTVVWYVDGAFHNTMDIAFGDTIPTLDIPEKEGHTAVWDSLYRTMPAMDIEINAVYTARKYTVYWKVDGLTVYSASVSYGTSLPAQAVPAKPGQTGVWVDVPATMPAENITIEAKYTPNTYTVMWRVDGVQTTGEAVYGNDYTILFDTATFPEDVRVSVGGTTVGTESYVYDATTGELTIFGSAIVGDIVVVARAAGGNFNVIVSVFNGSFSNTSDVVPERTTYHTTIIPEEGYLLPESVAVYIDGILVPEGYTYDAETGRLTINSEVIIGELEIYAECPEDPNYDPSAGSGTEDTDCDCDCHSSSAFTRFFFAILNFFRRIFGMTEYRFCECGTAHW